MRWFALVVASVVAVALFAGCLEEQKAPEAEAQVEPDDDPGRVARQGRDRDEDGDGEEDERTGDVTERAFRDEFGFTLTSANALISFNLGDYDCVAVEGAPFHVLNGTATLAWASQSALTDNLDLEVFTYYTGTVEQASGTSPLVVEFRDLEVESDPDEGEDVLLVSVRLSGPANAAYEQDVTLSLAFGYESDIDVEAYATYC